MAIPAFFAVYLALSPVDLYLRVPLRYEMLNQPLTVLLRLLQPLMRKSSGHGGSGSKRWHLFRITLLSG